METHRPIVNAEDPRRLRDLLARARDLSTTHALPSVVVGLAGREGDLLLPELVRYIESALRVEDSVFRLTRERAVLFLSDVDAEQARRIVERLVAEFHDRFPASDPPSLTTGFYEVPAGTADLRLKDILPAIF